MNDGDSPFFVVIQTIPNVISFFACLYLFIYYIRTQERTFDLKMIFVLSISDFFLHAFTILIIWIIPLLLPDLEDQEDMSFLQQAFIFLLIFPLHFSLFWMGCMSYMLMKSLAFEQDSSSRDYSRFNLCLLTIPAIIMTIS